MNILSIDTSCSILSFAVKAGSSIISKEYAILDKLSVNLLSFYDEFMAENSIDLDRDIDLILLGTGPGSFTSLRVGFIFAKMLSYVCEKPIYCIKSMFGLTYNALRNNPDFCGRNLITALDAGRNELFYCITRFESVSEFIEPADLIILKDVCLISRVKFKELDFLHDDIILTDTPAMGEILKNRGLTAIEAKSGGRAESMIHLYKTARKSENILLLEPDYIRKSDAEANLERRGLSL